MNKKRSMGAEENGEQGVNHSHRYISHARSPSTRTTCHEVGVLPTLITPFQKEKGPKDFMFDEVSCLSSGPQLGRNRNLEMSWGEGVLLLWVSNFRSSPKEHLPSVSKALYCILSSRKLSKIKGTNHWLSLSEQLNMRRIAKHFRAVILCSLQDQQRYENVLVSRGGASE